MEENKEWQVLKLKDEREKRLKETEERLEAKFPGIIDEGKGRNKDEIAKKLYPVLMEVAKMKGFVSYGWIQKKFKIGQAIIVFRRKCYNECCENYGEEECDGQ